ncbi:complement regulator-acquiring protein [Borrelia venezuelensis]|uniref:complement regulator-acquiring protein n=1 Tax=Borrelia venezuelensis TaxID=1653839 RepID=UPI001FF41250|nr:complement regulator-acquiring protein [Borrelia venezuelensis]UPA12605.1 complement regulator-acquiring protein [Borrelia venezuelensis]
MKHILDIFIITLILPLLVLIACGSNPKPTNQLNTSPKKDIFIMGSKTKNNLNIKINLTNQIKNKVDTELTLLEKHSTDIIKEPVKQLGIQCAIFDEIHYHKIMHSLNKIYPINKEKIKLFHASLNYNIIRLKWLGEILIQMQAINTKKGNELYKSILDTGREYSQKSFEALMNQINIERDKLILLNVEQLKDITNNLDTIKNLRTNWISFIDDIINDYRTDTDIKNNSIKLIEHITTKYKKIEDKINGIKDIAHKTNKILKTIKHQYYINKQLHQK